MAERESSYTLPPAIKVESKKKDITMQHPLVAACMKPKKNNTATCEICFLVFKQKKFLLQHKISDHGYKPEWQCKICDMVLCSKYILESHMDAHKNIKKYKCSVCPASFNTRASQKRHFLYKHTDERPHRCSMCNFATVEHDKLLIHLRNHTGESPYKCDVCGMTFKTAIHYKRHVVVHTGWRQYLCTVCLKKFGTPVTVKQHMFVTHGILRSVLTKVKTVKEHGVPSMLAKFLENEELGESETKMIKSLKYYDIQEDAVDKIEIANVDFTIFEKTKGQQIIDKSSFFVLKNKNPVNFIVKQAIEEKGEFKLEDPSWTVDDEPSVTKTKLQKASFVAQTQQANYMDSNRVKEAADAFKTVDDFGKGSSNLGQKGKRGRKVKAKTETVSEIKDVDESRLLQLADEEAVKVLEKLQAKENQTQFLKDPETKRMRRSGTALEEIGSTDLEDDDNKKPGQSKNLAPVNDEVNTMIENEFEEESQETSVFVNHQRKSYSLSTPRLASSPDKGKQDEKLGTLVAPKRTQNKLSPKPGTFGYDMPGENPVKQSVNAAQQLVDDGCSKTGSQEITVYEEEIPYETNIVSVVENPAVEGTGTSIPTMQADDTDSETNIERFENNILKGNLPKSLPPFISLERCSSEHRDRLLLGMKKGVFGPSPSVVRVLEDGSMINVSNLYKTYLPKTSVT